MMKVAMPQRGIPSGFFCLLFVGLFTSSPLFLLGSDKKREYENQRKRTDLYITEETHLWRNRKLWSLIWLVICAVVGKWQADGLGSHFFPPHTLGDHRWHPHSSGLRHVATFGEGVYVVDGQLTIDEFAALSLMDVPSCREVEIVMGEKSDILELRLAANRRSVKLQLQAHRYSVTNSEWVAGSGTGQYRIDCSENGFFLHHDGKKIDLRSTEGGGATDQRQKLQLSATTGKVFIQQLRYSGGQQLIKHDFRVGKSRDRVGLMGAGLAVGLGFGLLVLLITGSPWSIPLSLLLCALPIWTVVQPFTNWLGWIERLYMTQTKPWELARWVLLLSYIPLISVVLGRTILGVEKLGAPNGNVKKELGIWLLLALGVAFFSSESIDVLLLPKVLFLLLPMWVVRDGSSVRPWLLREMPIFALLLVLGWAQGLWLVLLLRFVALAYSLRALMEKHAQFSALSILLIVLCFPLALEAAIRSTYLGQIWDFEKLSLEYNAEDRSEFVESAWDGVCGNWVGKKPY